MRTNSNPKRPVGLVVEGKSEYYAVPVFAQRLKARHTTPAVFRGQPAEMSADALAHRILPTVRSQRKKGVRKVLVVLDRESREPCSPDIARDVSDALAARLRGLRESRGCEIQIVVPDRKFENWLLADPVGLASHALIRRTRKRATRNLVDGFDGEAELRTLVVSGRSYEKGEMTGDLAKCVRVERAEVQRRSRSLRKFVKEFK